MIEILNLSDLGEKSGAAFRQRRRGGAGSPRKILELLNRLRFSVSCLLKPVTMDTRSTLLNALQALYHHPEQQVRSAANKWLEDFQRTTEAWQVSDTVLHDPNSSFEALYFCSQTLRTKVQRDFEELPPGAAISLRSSIMVLLLKFRQGPAAVRTQLCLAIASLAVHMPSEQWGDKGIIQWLGNELGSHPNAISSLLELIAVLPQEANSLKIAVRPERRRQFQKDLAASVQDAFDLLTSVLKGGTLELQEQVIRAFAAWLRLSYGVQATALASHPLVLASLSGLSSEQTFDAAVDAVADLIRYTVSATPADLAAHMPLVQVLVPRVMELRPRFVISLKVAKLLKEGSKDVEDDEEDEEVMKGIAYLFAEMGESYAELIASGSGEAMMIVEAILEVTSHPDYDIASITFNFWHRLSRVLTRREHYKSFENDAAIDAERERRIKAFRPSYELFVSLISFRVTYPPDFESWRKDELADFKQTRYAIADMLLDATEVLGGIATLHLLANPLLRTLEYARNASSWDWRSVEASLYCVRAIARTVPSSEDIIMPQIMALLPQLPAQSQLLYTSSLTIAAYADWLGAFRDSSSFLPHLVQLLINSLSLPEDPSAAASLALKHVCDACRVQLAGSLDSLLEIYCQVMSKSVDKFKLTLEDELQLVEGLSMVVSALPLDRVSPALEAISAPVLSPLQHILAAGQQSGSTQQFTSSQYTLHINRIANIFRYVSQPEPLAKLFQHIWPSFKAVFSQRSADLLTMERLCRACKYAVRTCGRSLGPSMEPLLQELQEQFRLNRHSCFLYLASEVIKVFGGDSACAHYLGNLIGVLFGETFTLLRRIEDFTSRPDLVDDCFLLASRCVRYCPHLLFPSAVFPALLDCAMAGITIQHREACRSILTFLVDVMELDLSHGGRPYKAAIDAAMLPRGATLTRVLIAALVGALPESRLDEVIHAISTLARLYGGSAIQWAQATAALIPASVVTENEKMTFLQALSSVAAGAESSAVSSSMEEISDVCRRNKKVLETVQSALQPLQLTSSLAG